MLEIGSLITEGRTKRLYATGSPDEAVMFFKDEAIAYHGLKRGRILGKGEVNNEICNHLFTLLSERGIPNHYLRKLDARQSLVRRLDMIPLEVKVRNFAAGTLCERLGIPEGTRLNAPVL